MALIYAYGSAAPELQDSYIKAYRPRRRLQSMVRWQNPNDAWLHSAAPHWEASHDYGNEGI